MKARLFDNQIRIQDADRLELLDEDVIVDDAVHRADTHALQGRAGGTVFVDEGIADTGRVEQAEPALRILAFAERANLNIDLVVGPGRGGGCVAAAGIAGGDAGTVLRVG